MKNSKELKGILAVSLYCSPPTPVQEGAQKQKKKIKNLALTRSLWSLESQRTQSKNRNNSGY